MRLRDWIVTGIAAVALLLSPVMLMPLNSPFGQGYIFLEQLSQTAEPFTWVKNPIGKPLKNYASGVRANIYHLCENHTHWDLAGEVVLDWPHRVVFPFAYFYDIMADNWKIALSPTLEEDSKKKGSTLILGRVESEQAAKLGVVMLWAKFKGMRFNLEEIKKQPLLEASL